MSCGSGVVPSNGPAGPRSISPLPSWAALPRCSGSPSHPPRPHPHPHPHPPDSSPELSPSPVRATQPQDSHHDVVTKTWPARRTTVAFEDTAESDHLASSPESTVFTPWSTTSAPFTPTPPRSRRPESSVDHSPCPSRPPSVFVPCGSAASACRSARPGSLAHPGGPVATAGRHLSILSPRPPATTTASLSVHDPGMSGLTPECPALARGESPSPDTVDHTEMPAFHLPPQGPLPQEPAPLVLLCDPPVTTPPVPAQAAVRIAHPPTSGSPHAPHSRAADHFHHPLPRWSPGASVAGGGSPRVVASRPGDQRVDQRVDQELLEAEASTASGRSQRSGASVWSLPRGRPLGPQSSSASVGRASSLGHSIATAGSSATSRFFFLPPRALEGSEEGTKAAADEHHAWCEECVVDSKSRDFLRSVERSVWR